jgi:hypothetical protein
MFEKDDPSVLERIDDDGEIAEPEFCQPVVSLLVDDRL